jgi:hypothetical protein
VPFRDFVPTSIDAKGCMVSVTCKKIKDGRPADVSNAKSAKNELDDCTKLWDSKENFEITCLSGETIIVKQGNLLSM